MILPVLLLSWIGPLDFLKSKKAARFFGVLYCFLTSGVILIYAIDLGYYAYLKNRLNASSLILLQDSKTALEMMWETYPVVWGALAILILNFSIYKIIPKYLLTQQKGPIIFKKSKIAFGVTFFLVNTWFVYGSITRYPLRWSEALFSKNVFINSLGLNPVLYFADTFSYRNEGYDSKNYEKYFKDIATYYGTENKDLTRSALGAANGKIPNVVVIVMESMASHKSSIMNNPLNTTPYLKQLADESVLFDRYYVPVESTARSMFAIMTSVPDVSLAKSASRNPMIAKRHLIMDDFKGHDKYYFLGGSANWGQIRAVFTNNVDGIKIYEEGSYKSPAMDVWGISDLDLSKEAHQIMAKSKKPFFAVIQYASFHRPYTIPKNKDNFKEIKATKEELAYSGFTSNEQLNSLRFSDYALGEFIRLAKESAYYKNTIFVITGDHGLPDEGAGFLPKPYKELHIANFHVPLIIHYPGLEPRVDSTIASEVDVMPTIASLAGITFKNEGLGHNLFDRDLKERYAFTYFWYNTNYNLISDKHFLKVNSSTQESELYDLTTGERLNDLETQNKLYRLVSGFYESSRYLLFKNMHLSLQKK